MSNRFSCVTLFRRCRSKGLLAGLGLLAVLGGTACQTDGNGPNGDALDMAAPPDLAPMLGPDEIPLKVVQRCPGDPGCADTGDGTLYVGVSKRDISPDVEPFDDKNANGVWDTGEPFTDKNGNGQFDAFWMAGFGDGRLAYGVHDPVWARALAIKQNQTTVVMVAVDTLGLFEEETHEVEKLLRKELGIDLLTISATHVHEAADLVGAWGAGFGQYGVNEDYRTKVRKAIADAVTDAVQSVQPARMTLGSIAVQDANRDMKHYVSDTRDPVVIDNTLHTMQFVDTSSTPPKPIATVVNWAFHPESVGDKNHLISSDFVHVVREDLEKQGSGTVLYISGALGGQIGPGRVEAIDGAGNVIKQSGFPKAEAIGHSVSRFALTAMADPKAVTVDGKTAKLGFRTATVAAQIANRAYHLAFMFKVYRRSLCCYDTKRAIDDDNLPSVQTQMAYLTLGPASIVTNPGELLPELFIGGYGGEYAGTYTFIDMTKPNSADVSRAPKPPYLVDIMDGQRPHRMTFGLTMDMLGYIVPRYNWVLDEKRPYIDEAAGNHYEETNSIGPLAEPQIVGTMRQLILDGRPNVAR